MNNFLRPNRSVSWPKNKCTKACPRDVDGGRDADLTGGELDAAAAARSSRSRDIADHRDFEAVQHPDSAEADDDAPVETVTTGVGPVGPAPAW